MPDVGELCNESRLSALCCRLCIMKRQPFWALRVPSLQNVRMAGRGKRTVRCGVSELTQRGQTGLLQAQLLLTQHKLARAEREFRCAASFSKAAIGLSRTGRSQTRNFAAACSSNRDANIPKRIIQTFSLRICLGHYGPHGLRTNQGLRIRHSP